jgi:hypothetical protein
VASISRSWTARCQLDLRSAQKKTPDEYATLRGIVRHHEHAGGAAARVRDDPSRAAAGVEKRREVSIATDVEALRRPQARDLSAGIYPTCRSTRARWR